MGRQRLLNVKRLTMEVMPNNPYHNLKHVMSVYSAVNKLTQDGVNQDERFLLRTSALLHDIIYVIGRKDNEERSAEFSERYLPGLLYSPNEIEVVSRLILATKMPQEPRDYLEMVICDADLDNLGRKDFFELGEKVREECGVEQGRKWYEIQLKFLTEHKYHTQAAKQLRNSGKQRNIKELERRLRWYQC